MRLVTIRGQHGSVRQLMVIGRDILTGIALLIYAGMSMAMSVTFLNPGKSDEKFWSSVSQFMLAAAEDLEIELDVIYAERDPVRMVENARRVIARSKRPDYVVTVNEKLVAGEILRLTANTGIKVFLINNTLSADEQAALGKPRQGIPHWLGSLVPNNEDAGYQMANQLIQAGRKGHLGTGTLSLFAINGDRSTAAGLEREAGLRRAVTENKDVSLSQIVYGEWNQQRAREQAEILFWRHPDARLVWCANDLMAFGAMEAATKLGKQPGKDVLFSGLNNSPEAMQALRNGSLSALASGHFSTGGWAMVMLHDYHNGHDFAKAGPIERIEPLFVMLTPVQAGRFLDWQAKDKISGLDFRAFSRQKASAKQDYRFSILPFLK